MDEVTPESGSLATPPNADLAAPVTESPANVPSEVLIDVQGRIRLWRMKQALFRGVLFCALVTILLVLCGLIRDRWEAQAAPDFLQELARSQPVPERLAPFDPAEVVTRDITLSVEAGR